MYRRQAEPAGDEPTENILAALNFSDVDRSVWLPFEGPGAGREMIDSQQPAVQINRPGDWTPGTLPSIYRMVYMHG